MGDLVVWGWHQVTLGVGTLDRPTGQWWRVCMRGTACAAGWVRPVTPEELAIHELGGAP